jgi:hypothetical protein
MYGKYHEAKFEALGLTFRLENLATVLMDKLISQINMNYITAKSLRKIARILELFRQGLMLDGVYNQGFDSNLKMFQYSLTSASFSLDQFVNLFQFMAQDIRAIINEYFLRNFDSPLKTVIMQQKPYLRGPSVPAAGPTVHPQKLRKILSGSPVGSLSHTAAGQFYFHHPEYAAYHGGQPDPGSSAQCNEL